MASFKTTLLLQNKFFAQVLIIAAIFFSTNISAQNGPNCPTICYGPGGTSTGDLTIQANSFYSSITVKSGKTLRVQSGYTLYVGQVGTSATTQVVDFQNGSIVIVEEGAYLVVNGLMNNSNNSDHVTFNGNVSVTGNVTAGSGSSIVGTGTMTVSGQVSGSGTISVIATTAGAIGSAQTICQGTAPATLTSTTNGTGTGTISYEWQSDASGSYATIANAVNASYTPGVLTATTNFRRRTVAVSGSTTSHSDYTSPVTITVSAPVMPLAGTVTQPTCTVNTGSVALSNLPGGNWTLKSGNTVIATASGNTYTASGLASGTYNFAVTNASGCTSPASSNVVINAAPTVPTTPTVGTITQPSASVSTGSVVLSGLTVGNTINPGNISVTATSMTISNLAPGTYNFTVKNSTCTSSATANVVINQYIDSSIKTWNGSVSTDWFNVANWTPNGVPTSSADITIPANLPAVISSSNAVAKTITVANGGKLDINPTGALTVTDKVTVITGGTFNLQNGASLIQTNNTANEGTINVYRNSAKIILNDYTYWSAPTSGTQTLLSFSPDTNAKYFLAYSNGWSYLNAAATTFSPGTGYAILAPNGTNSTVSASKSFQFIGTPNNGNISVSLVKSSTLKFSSKMVGNPYPSAIDADKFIDTNIYDAVKNPNGTISGTLYFWTHNNGYANGTYTSNDYATYNKSGGTSSSSANVGHANTMAPAQFIASCQGFVVETKRSGNLVFTNAMRSNGTASANGNFYKNADAASSKPVLEKNRIWLNFTNNGGANFSQLLLGYIETATNDYDPGFDGAYNSSSKTGIYTLLGNSNYAIQAKALPFNNTDIVPLGYTTDIKGNSTISLDSVDGLFTNSQDIFIEDKVLNIVHNLKEGAYTFTTEAGTYNSRFVLKYTNTTNALGVNDFEAAANDVAISSQNKQIKIQSDTESIDQVFVYDISGREVYQNSKVDSTEASISVADEHILIVKVVLANGKTATKKVMS